MTPMLALKQKKCRPKQKNTPHIFLYHTCLCMKDQIGRETAVIGLDSTHDDIQESKAIL
ncbi:hypothetical protein [Desulfosarcina variabilis]|uniref:hypothetical protein n=1 Tax=Desulfosarcina variabilis TaxID=2300 RepID=UPI003AFA12BB